MGSDEMARVKVTHTRKTKGRRSIVGLYGPSMGYQDAEEVIDRIRRGVARYYVREGSWEADLRVVEEDGELKLVSTADFFSRNHLANLPDC